MNLRFSLFILVSFISVSAIAKKKPLPLLAMNTPRSTTQNQTTERQKEIKTPSRKTAWAFDVGMLSRFQNTPGRVLGMTIGVGAKANLDIPIGSRFHLIPHLGYFYEREGDAAFSFNTHSLLVGAQALASLNPGARTEFRLGIESSFVTSLSYLSMGNQGSTNPLFFDTFIGPKLQLGTLLESQNEIQFNLTPTYALSNTFYLFFTVGFKFSSK